MTSRVKPPLRYLVRDVDRHGNVRWYLRLPSKKKHRMKAAAFDESGSLREAFVAEYHAVLAGDIQVFDKTPKRPEDKTSLNWLIREYFASPKFLAQADATKRGKRGVLLSYADQHGHRPYKGFKRKHLEMSQQKRSETPAAADNLIKYLKALYNWAIENDLAEQNPANGIGKINRSHGHHAWTEDEIHTFREFHRDGSTARLALELALNTGARLGDLIGLGRANLKDWQIQFQIKKDTGGLPITIRLRLTERTKEQLGKSANKGLIFILNEHGRPFSEKGFGNRMKKWCTAAGLPDKCTTHGLRKASAINLAYHGATAPELMAVFGWTDMKTALYYIEQADKQRLRDSAIAKLDATQRT